MGTPRNKHRNPTLLGNIPPSPLTHPPQSARRWDKPVCSNLQLISHICPFFLISQAQKKPKFTQKEKNLDSRLKQMCAYLFSRRIELKSSPRTGPHVAACTSPAAALVWVPGIHHPEQGRPPSCPGSPPQDAQGKASQAQPSAAPAGPFLAQTSHHCPGLPMGKPRLRKVKEFTSRSYLVHIRVGP